MPNETGTMISARDVETFEQDGVVHLKGVLDAPWVERMQRAVDRLKESPSARGGRFKEDDADGRFFGDLFMWTFDDDFRALACDSPLPDIAGAAMRSKKVNLVWDQLICKEPDTPYDTPWHQDQPYAWADGAQTCSFWVSLDRATLDSGVMQFVRGSHLGPCYQPIDFYTDRAFKGDEFDPLPDINAHRDDFDIVYFETEPGDAILHHLNILHYASGNRTASRRRAVALRYSGDDAVYAKRKFGPPPLYDPGLECGDPLDSELFPVVRPAPASPVSSA